jgi:hypothetical protein
VAANGSGPAARRRRSAIRALMQPIAHFPGEVIHVTVTLRLD